MNPRFATAAGLLVLAGIFLGVNLLANASLRSAKIDFTADRLYTLSEGSKNITRSIDEPITLDFYYSSKVAVGLPNVQAYARRVRELLEEYVRVSDGMLLLRVIDPEPFTDSEDRAMQAGARGIPIGDGGVRLYFALHASNAVGDRRVIPLFDPEQERFLELEISRLLHALTNPDIPTVGLITTLEIGGARGDQATGRAAVPAWQIARELQPIFDVRRLDPRTGRIPDDIDVLLVIHPKNLSAPARYAIDQFVLAGKPLFIAVDPHSEADTPDDPSDQVAAVSHVTGSGVPDLFRAWGVSMDPEVVAADIRLAIEAVLPGQREAMKYIPWLGLGPDNLNRDDPITGRLGRVNFGNAGVIDTLPDARTTVERLAWTSTQSMRFEAVRARLLPDPKRLTSVFEPGDEELALAVRITGPADSAFPQGPPPGVAPSPIAHLARSEKPITVVAVADTDAFSDRFWLSQNALGVTTKVADNGDFLVNALDHLAGSTDLISLRAGGAFSRPFDRVNELRARAEDEYRAEQLKLEQEIRQTQSRIDQVRAGRTDSSILVDPQVRQEIDALNARLLEARKELRDVQHRLRRDVEVLGLRLKLINSALTPAIIALAAIGLALARASRRRADRHALAQLSTPQPRADQSHANP